MTEVKELIFGTGNQAKIQQVQSVLGDSVRVRGVNEFDIDIKVREDGKTAQENARKKATAYASALRRTVFAMDNALYLKGLADNEQPGLYVRRVGGVERLTDQEMIESYRALIASQGEQIEGYWESGVSIARPDGTSVEDSIISPRIFVAKASDRMVPGYPLESIQIDPETGKYISEMSAEEQSRFWQQNIGEPLSRFIQANL